jgi:hypothetical protein
MELNFKAEYPFDAISMEDRTAVEELFRQVEAMITQDDNKPIQSPNKKIINPDANPLIPYGDFAVKNNKTGSNGFLRDQPDIARFAMANPENLASVIIFVLLTIRADFQQVMHDFPVIMMKLHTKFANKNPSPQEWQDELNNMEKTLSSKTNPAKHDNEGFSKGFGLSTTAFGFKNKGIPLVWSNRQQIFSAIKGMAGNIQKDGEPFGADVVKMHKYLTQSITGLAPIKAAFVVQLIVGKLGCIDMHNVNLYSQYAKYMKATGPAKDSGKYDKLHGQLDPTTFSGKSEKDIQNYIGVLKALEKEGAGTVKLWDIWTNFVAHNYTNQDTGHSTYDSTSPFAGQTTDPNDPLVQRFEKMAKNPEFSAIPDRAGGKETKFSWGTTGAGGSASRSHSIIPSIRNKQFWMDILQAAENPNNPPSEVRFRRPSEKHDRPHKALAYIVNEPELADELGLGQEYVARAKEVLKANGDLPSNFVSMGQGKKPVPGLFQTSPDATGQAPAGRAKWSDKAASAREKKAARLRHDAEMAARKAAADKQQMGLFGK